MVLKKSILTVLFIVVYVLCYAQETYQLRLALSSIDTSERIACYNLQLANGGMEEWYLGNSNIFIFYDFSVACFLPDRSSLILDDVIYDLNDLDRNSNKVDDSGFPLPYQATLGTIRAGFSTNLQGVLMDSVGTWVSTVELCFSLLMDSITSPNTCFQADFINQEIEDLLPVRDIVQKFDPEVFVSDVQRDTAINVVPNATKTSCFILEEDSVELCGDGIDNDEDGLMDCEDTTGCSPNQPTIVLNGPGGCEDLPSSIEILGIGANAMFSIDDGATFQTDSVFVDVPIGEYEILIVKNDVMTCAQVSFTVLEEQECIETSITQCSDGIDNDNDGLVDCDDPDCQLMDVSVDSNNPENCPALNNGFIEVAFDQSVYELSIDSGLTFVSSNQVNNLTIGDYYIVLKNKNTLCLTSYIDNPIVLGAEVCPDEVGQCNDGIDNDQDGLIDCEDSDCIQDQLCADLPSVYIPNAINPMSTMNGTFGVSTSERIAVNIDKISIYDRWGGLIHERSNTTSDDFGHRWDGMTNNGLAMAGVYIYKVSISLGARKEEISGNLTVIY